MPTSIIAEARVKAAEMFFYFSSLLDKDVKDKEGRYMGSVWDVAAKLGETYPKASEIIIVKGFLKRSFASVKWTDVYDMEDDVMLALPSAAVQFGPEIKEYELLLRRDILDQQVVDTFNHKVRRVNDIHLLHVDHDIVIAHVDIGLRGLIRRLGWEKAADFLVRLLNKRSRYLKAEDFVAWKHIQPVALNPASMTMKLAFSERQLASIPAADLGDIIFDLNPNQRMAVFRSLEAKTKAKVFDHLDFDEQKIILKELDKKEAAQIVEYMASDDATDLLEKLPRNTVKNLLTLIETTRAKKLSTLMGYSGDSAGGLMTTEYVAISEAMTVESAIEYIKTQTKEFDVVPYIYIVDEKNHLKGVTTVRRLLFADPKDNISKTVFPKTLYVYLDNSVKEVAYMMDRYKMSSIPVLDENKVIHGVITVDDVLSQVVSIAWRKKPRPPTGP